MIKQARFILVVAFALTLRAEPPEKPDLLTGNLSTDYLKWALEGRKGDEPKSWSPAYFASLRLAGVNGVEDYITFCALEPERDRPDWHFYRHNCELVRAAGMRYGVYPWLHFAPKWFVNSPDYAPYVCLEHNQPTDSTSLWAPGTLVVYDRFYGQLRRELGDKVQDIHASMPADYGEVGFPVGMSSWLVPQDHKHRGFWCGDKFARADFREHMRARYQSLDRLNQAWGTRVDQWEALPYPTLVPPEADDPCARRRWLDFVGWYADSQTEFVQKAVAVIRKHFPTTPIQIKLGYGGEHVEYGVDNSGVVRLAARDHVIVRSTHGKLPAFFYKRFSTPAWFYGAKLLTEPPSGVNRDEEVTRMFNDAGNLSSAYFDYPANIMGAVDLFDQYLPWVRGERACIRVAFLFPTSDHRLRAGQWLPQRLFDQAAALRDIADYDLVDENLVRDGALRDHRLLVLFEGNWLEQRTLDALAQWVRAGGTLLLNDFCPIASIEGDTRTYRELLGPLAARAGDESVLMTTNPPPRMTLDVGAENDNRFLGDGWWNAETNGGITRRWTKGEANFRVLVDPARDLSVTVVASAHQRPAKPQRLRVNGRDAGELRFIGEAATVRVPATLLGHKRRALFTIVTETWRPSDRTPENTDRRQLGIWVDRVEVTQKGAEQTAAQPPPEIAVDAARLVREFSRPVGKGRVIFCPFGPEEALVYRGVIRHCIYEDGTPLQPRVDTEFDGVDIAILPARILFLNGTSRAITKRVQLRPADFSGMPGPTPPARDFTLPLAPHSITAVRRADGTVLPPPQSSTSSIEDLAWWVPNHDIGECAVEKGVLRVRTNGSDPSIRHGRPWGLNTRQWPRLFLRVRTDVPHARLYWTTDLHPKMTDATSHGFALPADGAWHDVRVDLRAAPMWEGNVHHMRLDLDAPHGYAEFKVIRLEPDETARK